MPTNKDLKRRVRARMKKTGEAYTTARANVIKKPKARPISTTATPTARGTNGTMRAPVSDYARVAGMSDEKIKDKTGCTWDRWVGALDYLGAQEKSHREIAEIVSKKFKIGDWWSQTVTVGYERIKGLRARGQRRDGSYEATKSRTFDVPVKELFDAWVDEGMRRRWLNGESVRIRTATSPKSMRLDWTDGTIIAVGFAAKGKHKSSVAVQHTKLPDRETAEGLKKYWADRLDTLREVLSNSLART
jgi:hypothetical protein